MGDTEERRQLLWAKWLVHENGSLTVMATYAEEGSYMQETKSFASLAEATAILGQSFQDVVTRAREVRSLSGRWRP
jgi:hypothetical protein